jgi:molybdenum ABC transporter molybdate-binding protein
MFGRTHPAWVAFGGSLVLLAGLVGILWWNAAPPPGPSAASPPLTVLAGASLLKPLRAVAQDYEKEFGQVVHINAGPSELVLTQLELGNQNGQAADLFVPADEVYIDRARDKGLVNDVLPLARMTAVVVVRPDFPSPITSWSDLVDEGVRIVVADRAAAIGQMTEDALGKKNQGAVLRQRTFATVPTVTQVAETVHLKAADAGIVWDATAHQYPDLKVVRLPELKSVAARVQVAVASQSPNQADAHRFARYLAARDKGARRFQENGFGSLDDHDAFGDVRPRLVLYAGSMLRPAIEQTVREFAEREGVEIDTVYNGCGILVGQMRTGVRPDVYFSCDPRFMTMVEDLFEPAQVVSSNQLVIAVPRGNPHGVKELKDLGKPGLKVGVGHEHQCALGTITKETFLQTGAYAAVKGNIVQESPSGDVLISQLRLKALDAVVAYRSNALPFQDELEAIPVTGIPCAAPQQPVAVGRTTAHPELVRRLLAALRSAESKERFTSQGFGWSAETQP